MNTYQLRLDLNKGPLQSVATGGTFGGVTIRQGDHNGTIIAADLYDHGVRLSETGLGAYFVMPLPDREHYYRKQATYADGTVTVTIDEAQAASVVGTVENAYFELTRGTTVIASTQSFRVAILRDALEGATVAESYDSAIQDAIDALDEAIEAIPDTVEDVLEAHPEWVTTVQDGAVTDAKLYQGADGILARNARLMYRLDNLLTNALPEGDSATATDAARTPLAGLALFGLSTQDGTPTPSAPVPIVSVQPDSEGNISLLSKRTSDATQQTVTPIDLDGHELRSLPDGTRDELRVDERGHAVLVQRVTVANLGTWDYGYNSAGAYFYCNITNKAVGSWNNVLCQSYQLSSTNVGAAELQNLQFKATNASSAVFFKNTAYTDTAAFKAAMDGVEIHYALATPVTHDLGWTDAIPLCGPDLTAQSVPTAPFALTYERDLNVTLARLEAAIAALA